MYLTHLNEGWKGELQARTNVGSYTCEHIRLNRPALLEWRLESRGIAADLMTLQALRETLASHLQTASELDLQERLSEQIAALDSTILGCANGHPITTGAVNWTYRSMPQSRKSACRESGAVGSGTRVILPAVQRGEWLFGSARSQDRIGSRRRRNPSSSTITIAPLASSCSQSAIT
jgi:hypothetical protein